MFPYYAIKTAQGYLAVQGNTYWFEDKPVGWAIYSTEQHAREVAESNQCAYGVNDGYGFKIERIGSDFASEQFHRSMVRDRAMGF
jgi:histidine ammonia-lyase